MQEHPAVAHPHALVKPPGGWNDWLGRHLVGVFGTMWTVWAFVVYPLLALLFPHSVQNVVFFISSGWIQLWALPLLNYMQNRADELRSAKADVDHQALTHVATTLDEATALISSLHARLDAMERKRGAA
jgi:hypothetical protein